MGILLDILSGIGNTLDVPGSMVRDTLGGENPFDQLMAPWRSNNRLSGRDLNRRWGLAGQEDTWGNLAGGIGTELATDPLNIIPGLGLLKRAFQGAKIAKATRAVDAANDASMALRAKGWMPEEVAQATKITTAPTSDLFQIISDRGNVLGGAATKDDALQRLADLEARSSIRDATVKQVRQASAGGMPATVYHETAAPVFGSHEFLPDPGTNNWLGKGTYFTKQPGEAGGAYSKWDKSKTILPDEPGAFVPAAGPQRIIEAFRKHMPERYFKDITPELERTHLPMIGATALENPAGYPKSLVEELRGLYKQNNPDPFDLTEFTPAAEAVRAEQSAPRTMMAYVDSRNPYTFEEPATLKDVLMGARAASEASYTKELRKFNREHGLSMPKLQNEITDALRSLRSTGEPITKGDIWAILRSEGNMPGKTPDEITDILREAGYDALQHEPGTGTRIQERMHDIGREAPDIDEHSELVVFSPSRIYEPFIAPSLRARPDQLKKIPRSLKAAFAAYQAGVAPSRGRSQE